MGTNLFELNGDDVLNIVDYDSKYPVVHKLTSTSSASVAQVTASTFSLPGASVEIVSDKDPNSLGRHTTPIHQAHNFLTPISSLQWIRRMIGLDGKVGIEEMPPVR